MVGGENLPGVFFADDLLLMSNREGDCMRQRGVVQAFIRSRKLEITFEKTQILKMGVQGKWECVLQDGNGQILGIVKETDIYRYLGMAVGRRGMIRQQIMESRAGIQSRIRRQEMQMRWQRRQI